MASQWRTHGIWQDQRLLQNPPCCPSKSDSLLDKPCPPSCGHLFIPHALPFAPSLPRTCPAASPSWCPHLRSSCFLPTTARWIFQNAEVDNIVNCNHPRIPRLNLPAHGSVFGSPKSIHSWRFRSHSWTSAEQKKAESTPWHVPSWGGTRPPSALVQLPFCKQVSFLWSI